MIVFYYGNDGDRTAVALKSLGAGPFASTNGTVTKYDGHAHTLAVTDEAGKEVTFKIDQKTVAETTMGAVPGQKFSAEKGDHVRVVSSTADGAPTALFCARSLRGICRPVGRCAGARRRGGSSSMLGVNGRPADAGELTSRCQAGC